MPSCPCDQAGIHVLRRIQAYTETSRTRLLFRVVWCEQGRKQVGSFIVTYFHNAIIADGFLRSKYAAYGSHRWLALVCRQTPVIQCTNIGMLIFYQPLDNIESAPALLATCNKSLFRVIGGLYIRPKVLLKLRCLIT